MATESFVIPAFADQIGWAVTCMLYTLLVILVAIILAAVVINFVRSGGRSV